jgi:pimeloyl-ACP methyl ester carboxylesterase
LNSLYDGLSMPRIILFPGLGADARLFAPQATAFPDLLVPPWIEPKKHEPLSAYAARLASTLSITPDTIIGGVSFGGMLSLEIAKATRPRAVILIASCRHPRAIAPSVQRFAKVGLKIPLPAAAARLSPLAVPALGPMGLAERKVILDMAESAPLAFIRWGGRAIMEWEGCESLPCPVLQIHGRRDRVISIKAVTPDIAIAGAGHVVNLTHAVKVNKHLRAFVDRLAATATTSSPARTSPSTP